MNLKRRYREREIAPDEIFLDASNIPDFDSGRLEGRLEAPLSRRAYAWLGGGIALLILILGGQAWNLQIRQGSVYASQSERNSLRPVTLFAPRGAITDRNGVLLAQNHSTDDGFTKRIYQAPGFAHLLGYVSYPKKDTSGNFYETETQGLAGVEETFNALLAGHNGQVLVEEDALGDVVSQGVTVPAVSGETLTLSIDARVQQAFYTAISQLAERIPFVGGSGVLMDVHTGEIYALVSYPEYDPNILSSGTPSEVIASYATDPSRPYVDRAVSGLYTPGSIVKPMEAAGAYSDGIIAPGTSIYSSGSISIPNRYNPDKPTIFRDWKAHGYTDMRHAIAVSSDVYFYAIGGGYGAQRGLGIERLRYWYEAFGLATSTGIELSGEAVGFVPSPAWKKEVLGEEWNIGNTYHTAIGQYAMQITPVEAARAVAAIANGGTLVTPTVIKDAVTRNVQMTIDPEGLRIAREGMRLGVLEGTSKGLNDLSFVSLASKTGTAQLGVNNEFYNMWVVGFFPYEAPKYAYVVVMERGPAGNGVGGIYAMHQILQEMHENAPEYFK